MSNPREAAVGDVIVTSTGNEWQLVERSDVRESWKDLSTGITWHDKEDGTLSHYDAVARYGDSLPTKEEWELADENGAIEVLPNMRSWFWSTSVHVDYPDDVYVFYGLKGTFDYLDKNADDMVLARIVSRA